MLDTFMSQLFEVEIGLNDALLENTGTNEGHEGPIKVKGPIEKHIKVNMLTWQEKANLR